MARSSTDGVFMKYVRFILLVFYGFIIAGALVVSFLLLFGKQDYLPEVPLSFGQWNPPQKNSPPQK